jgi:amino acid transporter
VVTFALIALSALVSRLQQLDLERPYRLPLWPLPPLVALAGVAATVLLQTGRDLAIVAAILAAGLLYDVLYLRPRRDTHWLLLEPLVSEPAGDDQAVLPKPDDLGTSP